jgi:hypothetical protein
MGVVWVFDHTRSDVMGVVRLIFYFVASEVFILNVHQFITLHAIDLLIIHKAIGHLNLF